MGRGPAAILAAVAVLIVLVAAGCAAPRKSCGAKSYQSCHKIAMQHMRYTQAAARAKAEGRLLVVIGNPRGGWVNRVTQGNGCGDVCVDLKGCKGCEEGGPAGGPTRVAKGEVLAGLRTVPTDGAVVFESEVLEYVEDVGAVLAELDRVTGGDHTRVYAVHTIGIQAEAWAYHTGGASPPPPSEEYLRGRKRNRWSYQIALKEGLARRVIYRYPPRDPYAWANI